MHLVWPWKFLIPYYPYPKTTFNLDTQAFPSCQLWNIHQWGSTILSPPYLDREGACYPRNYAFTYPLLLCLQTQREDSD